MKKGIFLFFLTMGLASFSSANILLEPYLGVTVSGKSSGDDAKYTGNGLGARVGWSMLGFGVGLDALLAANMSAKDDTGTTKSTVTGYGAFVSYTFPIMVRGYVSYFPTYTSKYKWDTAQGSMDVEVSGASNKVGVQYTGLPFVALGIEFETATSKKVKVDGVENTNVTHSTLSFTNVVISAPFSL